MTLDGYIPIKLVFDSPLGLGSAKNDVVAAKIRARSSEVSQETGWQLLGTKPGVIRYEEKIGGRADNLSS